MASRTSLLRYFIVPCVLLTGVGCGPAENRQTDQVPFDAATHIEAWVELWRTYDLVQLQQLFLWDSSATYLSSEREGLIQGGPAIGEHHAGMGFVDGGRSAEQELWVDNVHSSQFGATAVVTAVWYFGDPAASIDSIQRGPMTIVYVLTDGAYRIAHMHFANY